jgi:hypothetical protein
VQHRHDNALVLQEANVRLDGIRLSHLSNSRKSIENIARRFNIHLPARRMRSPQACDKPENYLIMKESHSSPIRSKVPPLAWPLEHLLVIGAPELARLECRQQAQARAFPQMVSRAGFRQLICMVSVSYMCLPKLFHSAIQQLLMPGRVASTWLPRKPRSKLFFSS